MDMRRLVLCLQISTCMVLDRGRNDIAVSFGFSLDTFLIGALVF